MDHKLSLLMIFLPMLGLLVSAAVAPIEFDCGSIPQTCSNMCFATNCAGSPALLTFDTRDATVKQNRRDAAGCTRSNRCNGRTDGRTTCDEYPFASTSQGGANAVTRCVSLSECQSQGGSLSAFYSQFDLSMAGQDRDFGIVVANFASVLYCNNASFCTNDGDQFQHGGPVRRTASAAAKPIGPVYATKSGVQVMSLMGELQPGRRIFRPDPSLRADDGCSDGTDDTRKRDVVDMEKSGEWDEIDHLVDV